MPSPSPDTTEHERIRKVYDDYASSDKHKRIWGNSAASRFMHQAKWRDIADVLHEARFDARAGAVLDIGAGGGAECSRLRDVGVPEDRLVGMDLLKRLAAQARRAHPWLASIQGDARRLPFRGESVALVYQSTMLSSVLDPDLRRDMLAEIGRVLRPGGHFLSYDTRYPNPWNPNTRPLRAGELRAAFPGWRFWIRSTNGIPQIIRLLAPLSMTLCRAVERIPPLRSHLRVLARKPLP